MKRPSPSIELPKPTAIEPPQSRVLAAMKAFPDAVTRNRAIRWTKPNEGADPEYHAPLSRMAGVLSDDVWEYESANGRTRARVVETANFSEHESAWAVYRLAERGLLVAGSEATNDGEHFWWTTRELWDWWRSDCPEKAATNAAAAKATISQGVFAYNGKTTDCIEPAPWRLLEFMDGKSEADLTEAYHYAIKDAEKDWTDSAIKSMVRQANAALEAVNHPLRLSKPKNVNKIVWA